MDTVKSNENVTAIYERKFNVILDENTLPPICSIKNFSLPVMVLLFSVKVDTLIECSLCAGQFVRRLDNQIVFCPLDNPMTEISIRECLAWEEEKTFTDLVTFAKECEEKHDMMYFQNNLAKALKVS